MRLGLGTPPVVMRNRKAVNSLMRVASAAAFLLTLTTSSLRPTNPNLRSLLPGYSRCHLAGVPARAAFPTRLVAAPVASRVMPVKALPSGNEEEVLDSTSRPAGWFFEVCPPHSVLASEKLGIGNVRLLHPLRC